MDDEFLYQFRKEPSPSFSQSLYRRITTQKQHSPLNRSRRMHLAFSLAVICAVFAGLFSFLAETRAALTEIIVEIGGMTFTINDHNPFMAGDDEMILTERVLSLSEADTQLPFELKIPTWVPEGFELQDQISVIEPQGDFPYFWVTLTWVKAGQPGKIDLRIEYRPDSSDEARGEIVGPESITEVQVNGQSAALVRGAWDHDTGEYDSLPFFDRLKWHQDNIGYTLSGPISLDELIRIAESLP